MTFGGSDEDIYAFGLDRVTDTEMFFLVSMYFSFPRGLGGPGKCFASGKHLWVSDVLKSSFDYCVRSFLAKSAGIQTVVLVPTDFGVVEMGSVRMVGESFELLQAVKSVFSAQASSLLVPHMVKPIAPLDLVREKSSIVRFWFGCLNELRWMSQDFDYIYMQVLRNVELICL